VNGGRAVAAVPAGDRRVLRELGRGLAEAAADGRNAERVARVRAMHALEPVRPPVWIDEVPWHEMDVDGSLALRCEDPEARELEQGLRRALFQWRHFQADMVAPGAVCLAKAYTDTGIGVEVSEQTASLDAANRVVSHRYDDQLGTEEQLAALREPVVTALPEVDRARLERWSEVLDGVVPVRLRGEQIYYQPWDVIAELRGVEAVLLDLADRPEFTHAVIRRMTEVMTSRYEQFEAQGLLEWDLGAVHSTPPWADGIPAAGHVPGSPARFRDVWFRGMAQVFVSASPEMRDEFDLAYMRPLMERCALSYYGCCEPLDRAVPYLKRIGNLRKVGCSAWADVASMAEQLGGDYVLSRKPNPALVAGRMDRGAVEADVVGVVEACQANGTPFEIVLKDVSTVGGRPANLTEWAAVVEQTLDRYY
jgi:hypothetical protein